MAFFHGFQDQDPEHGLRHIRHHPSEFNANGHHNKQVIERLSNNLFLHQAPEQQRQQELLREQAQDYQAKSRTNRFVHASNLAINSSRFFRNDRPSNYGNWPQKKSHAFAPLNAKQLPRASKSENFYETLRKIRLQPQTKLRHSRMEPSVYTTEMDRSATDASAQYDRSTGQFHRNIKQDHNVISLGLQAEKGDKQDSAVNKNNDFMSYTDTNYCVIPVGDSVKEQRMQHSCQVRVTQESGRANLENTDGLINKLIINLADRLEPEFHGLNVTRCSLGPATGASIGSEETMSTSSSTSTLDPKISLSDARLIIRVPTPCDNQSSESSVNSSMSRSNSTDSQNPLCPSCNGIVPLSHLESPLTRLKSEPPFWEAYPYRQTNLHRESSFHSSGGFTLNGHPGRIRPKKHLIRRLCSSHKVAMVVSTFSILVTIALVVTLLLMKKKGMMEPMR